MENSFIKDLMEIAASPKKLMILYIFAMQCIKE